jgi:AraC-like DNA-binding protein
VAEISRSTYEDDDAAVAGTVIDRPDAATMLTVRSSSDGHSEVMVMGPRTRALYHLGKPGPSCLQVRIKAGWARAVVGLAGRHLVDRLVPFGSDAHAPADELWRGLIGLGTEPGSLRDPETAARLEQAFDHAMSAGIASDRVRSELVHDATRLLSSSHTPAPQQVQAVARRLNVSERQLRNMFSETVGLSPKQYARIDRVRTVLTHAQKGGLAQAAARAGYYDQSHMTTEFRRIMGVSPGAFMAGELPAASPCGRRPG